MKDSVANRHIEIKVSEFYAADGLNHWLSCPCCQAAFHFVDGDVCPRCGRSLSLEVYPEETVTETIWYCNSVISLTTMPERGPRIEPVLDSLLAQGLDVYLWLPKVVARTGSTWNGVPKFFDKVHWEFVDDMGPATKLLPAIQAGFDTILTADDDHVYGPGWAKGLIDWAEKRPDAALGYRGRRLKKNEGYAGSKCVKNPREPVPVDLITGVRGALYNREFFDPSIFDEWQACPTNDDITIGAHLHRKGVPMLVIPRRCDMAKQKHWSAKPAFKVNRGAVNDSAVRKLYWNL